MTEFFRQNYTYISMGIFLLFSIPIWICDFISMRIPDLLVYAGTAALFCYRIAFGRFYLWQYVLAGILSVILFYVARRLSKNGMGWADVKYSATCGLYGGIFYTFPGYLLAALLCGTYFLILRLLNRFSKERAVPFAPFMGAGVLCVTLFPIVKHLGS